MTNYSGILVISHHSYAGELYGAKGAQQSPELTLETMHVYAILAEFLACAAYEHIIKKASENHLRAFRNGLRRY